MVKTVKLEELAKNKDYKHRLFEIEAVPVVVRKKSNSIRSIFKPKWTAVLQSDDNTMIAKHARFGSTYFHTDYDFIMLMYACEKGIPVIFRGRITEGNRGGMSGESDIPVFKVSDYKINDYTTAGWKY